MANSKFEAVSTAIRNKALELCNPMHVDYAKIYASVAIDAVNEWDKAIAEMHDKIKEYRVLKSNDRLISEANEFVKTEGMDSVNIPMCSQREILERLANVELTSERQANRLLALDKEFTEVNMAFRNLIAWKRKVCGQDE